MEDQNKLQLKSRLSYFLLLFVLSAPAFATDGAKPFPPEKVEPAHAKAVIALNGGHQDKAMGILNDLLQDYPGYVPALELKALIFRQRKKDKEAFKIYEELLSRVSDKKKRAPYQFEMASVYFADKKYDQARPLFQASLDAGFNWGASHYFLGLMDYQAERYKSAECHFNATTWSAAQDLRPLAAFYLGLIYSKMGYSPGMLWAFKESQAGRSGASAGEMKKVSDDVLKAFGQDRFFGNFTTSVQYDSNISILPDIVTAQQPSGQSSVKQIIGAGAGFMSSPTREVQVIAQYRNYYNYNYNPKVKGYSFFSNMPSVAVAYKPYARFTPGFKIEGNLTFNDYQDNGRTVFRPFSLIGTIGPYLKAEVLPRLALGLEFAVKPKKYYLDLPTGENRRSGTGEIIRLTADWFSGRRWLNPSGYVSYEKDDTEGTEFRAGVISVGVNNAVRITDRDTVTPAFDYARYRFMDRIPARKDHYFSGRMLYTHSFTSWLTSIVDVNYIRNFSTVKETYQYKRFMASVGANISF